MDDSEAEQARDRLADAVALYRLQSSGTVALLADEATGALVAGCDSPALRELAGVVASSNVWVVDALVDAVTAELHLTSPSTGGELEVRAAIAMCRRAVRGELEVREVVRWTHRVIGHEGPDDLQGLILLDDEYDLADSGYFALADVEETALRVVAAVSDGSFDLRS